MQSFETILITTGAAFLFITIFSGDQASDIRNNIISRIFSLMAGVLFVVSGVAVHTGWIQNNIETKINSTTSSVNHSQIKTLMEAIRKIESVGLSICSTENNEEPTLKNEK